MMPFFVRDLQRDSDCTDFANSNHKKITVVKQEEKFEGDGRFNTACVRCGMQAERPEYVATLLQACDRGTGQTLDLRLSAGLFFWGRSATCLLPREIDAELRRASLTCQLLPLVPNVLRRISYGVLVDSAMRIAALKPAVAPIEAKLHEAVNSQYPSVAYVDNTTMQGNLAAVSSACLVTGATSMAFPTPGFAIPGFVTGVSADTSAEAILANDAGWSPEMNRTSLIQRTESERSIEYKGTEPQPYSDGSPKRSESRSSWLRRTESESVIGPKETDSPLLSSDCSPNAASRFLSSLSSSAKRPFQKRPSQGSLSSPGNTALLNLIQANSLADSKEIGNPHTETEIREVAESNGTKDTFS